MNDRELLELAAKAAEIERLRGALKKISRIKDQLYGGEWDEIEKARKIAKKALSGEPT